jgi:putative ABC transport system permease protein
MLMNDVAIAWRNVKRRKETSVISILNLSLGIGCIIIIFSFIKYHLEFDDFHQNKERIYRVHTEFHEDIIRPNTGVPFPLAEALRRDYTVAENVARIAILQKKMISAGADRKFNEDVVFADPSFFKIMNFPIISGSRISALSERNTALITEKMAEKYFGERDPLGQIITLDDSLSVVSDYMALFHLWRHRKQRR